MLGALIGDVSGSRFEFKEYNKSKNLPIFDVGCRFTDDSLMTLAVAETLFLLRHNFDTLEYKKLLIERMVAIANKYPNVGWGGKFYRWLFNPFYRVPYNSFGNGAAMRISPIGWVANSEEEVSYLSKLTCEISHNHPEGIKGGECIAMCVYLARIGKDKEYIKQYVIDNYYPELKLMKLKDIAPSYGYDEQGKWVTCQGSVPHAVMCFIESTNFEDCIKNVLSLGGDVDTIGAMAGAIAEAYYGVSNNLEDETLKYFPEDLRNIYFAFNTIKIKREKRASD